MMPLVRSLATAFAAALGGAWPVHALALDPAGVVVTPALCAASVDAAAHAVFGNAEVPLTGKGYRAQDVLIDPVLRKAFVRVADCSDSRRPLTLVAIAAPLASAFVSAPVAAAPAHEPAAVAVRRGDAVDVLVQSASMHMTLHGKAAAEAALNGDVEVLLDGEVTADKPQRRIHGIATGAHLVEVHL